MVNIARLCPRKGAIAPKLNSHILDTWHSAGSLYASGMARRKKHPAGAMHYTCPDCGFISAPLTRAEWAAKRPIHEISIKHERAIAQRKKSAE